MSRETLCEQKPEGVCRHEEDPPTWNEVVFTCFKVCKGILVLVSFISNPRIESNTPRFCMGMAGGWQSTDDDKVARGV